MFWGRYSSLAALVVPSTIDAKIHAPENREARLYRSKTASIRRCFERLLNGIAKAHDCGFPNISRQQRRALARKGVIS